MGKILISYRILPTEVTIDLEELKQKIGKKLPEYSTVHGFVEEPIAYGLTALIAHIAIPEDESGGLDALEKALQKISEISQIETLTIHRFS
ncbi:MAG: elongation factor 1-beta [Candidatus Bathyarchaeota archaeon]|nr:MAG: elongation factor 1-beta [Candidatus Bathyarchaeota archaeon]